MAAVDDERGAPPPPEGFVQRWSRRKQAARLESAAPPVAPEPAAPPAAEPPRVLTDADMPPLESLGEESDYGGFLSPGVSEALRRQALHRLFALPGIGERCPLDSEYYDCISREPLGNVITHEMRATLEREAAQLKEKLRDTVREAMDTGSSQPAAGAPKPEGTGQA